ANLQGQNLVPILKNPGLPGRGWSLTQVRRNRGKGQHATGYTLRTPEWRYTEWEEGRDGRQLYDHLKDPREQANLAENPAYADRVAELSRRLREAVANSFPASGESPKTGAQIWAPNLTDP